jgi:hypothetical protein
LVKYPSTCPSTEDNQSDQDDLDIVISLWKRKRRNVDDEGRAGEGRVSGEGWLEGRTQAPIKHISTPQQINQHVSIAHSLINNHERTSIDG